MVKQDDIKPRNWYVITNWQHDEVVFPYCLIGLPFKALSVNLPFVAAEFVTDFIPRIIDTRYAEINKAYKPYINSFRNYHLGKKRKNKNSVIAPIEGFPPQQNNSFFA